MVLLTNLRNYFEFASITIINHLIKPIITLVSPKLLTKNIMYAFYDKRVSPTTFDFINFVILAEIERINKGCSCIHFVFVGYQDETAYKNEMFEFAEFHNSHVKVDTDYLLWRLNNILLPCANLIESCSGVTVSTSYDEAQYIYLNLAFHKFPHDYSVLNPTNSTSLKPLINEVRNGSTIPSLFTPRYAIDIMNEWIEKNCGGRKVITISLREATYNTSRNSNLEEWGKFISFLDQEKYCVVVVRDTYASDNLPATFINSIIFTPASWNMYLRMGLYSMSYLNLTVSNGTVALCIFNAAARYIVFKMLADSVVSSKDFLSGIHGIEFGDGPPVQYSEFQKIVWEDDTYDVIAREFYLMCSAIEGDMTKHGR
jgi:hypothetical protein